VKGSNEVIPLAHHSTGRRIWKMVTAPGTLKSVGSDVHILPLTYFYNLNIYACLFLIPVDFTIAEVNQILFQPFFTVYLQNTIVE